MKTHTVPDVLYDPPRPTKSPWIELVLEEGRVKTLSLHIQYLIMDELRKATCNSSPNHQFNAVILGYREYAALKKSIEDGITLRADNLDSPDGVVIFNGLTVLETRYEGIKIANIYNL